MSNGTPATMAGIVQGRLILAGLGHIVSKEVPNGTTVGELLLSIDGWKCDPASDQILLNGARVEGSAVLGPGFSVSITPKNTKMA